MPAGRSSAYGKTPARSARRLPPCASRSSSRGPILSKAIAPASASCVSPAPTALRASRRPRSGPSRSAPGPTAPSNPSSTTSSIGGRRPGAPRTPLRSAIATSAGPATTIEENADVLRHPTLDQLHALGLHGMAKAFADLADADEARDLAHADWLALLLDRETSWRRDKRLTARLRAARLRQQASVEDVDYRAARGLDRALFQKPSTGEWIDAHDNLVLVGPAGVGKSWLACAIGHRACRDNRSVLYHRWPKLCGDLVLARGDGRHPRLIRALGRADLLILDDFGLEPLDPGARHDLLEILEERYVRRSTISRPTGAAPRAGSSRYRGAASSRNPWAQSSRYRRAASSEPALPRGRYGEDLRQRPLEERRDELSQLIQGVANILFSEALSAEGALVFAKACELGLEGIVSKRAGSRYWSGHSRQWLKSKNPAFVRG